MGSTDPEPDAEPAPQPHPIPFAGPWRYELALPCDPRAPSVARATLRAILAAHGLSELCHRAELLASELTTNSIRHTAGPASISLSWQDPVLRVGVTDASPDFPQHRRSPLDADGGRGLLILDLVADRWGGRAVGTDPDAPGGKTIWFELTLSQSLPPDSPAARAG